MNGYPLLQIMETMFVFFLWVLWIILLFRVFADLFRDRHLNGWLKALWVIVLIVLPFLGVLIYLIARGRGMAERDTQQAYQQEQAFKTYVRNTVAEGQGGGNADDLTKLADLKSRGVLTDEEFQRAKARHLTA